MKTWDIRRMGCLSRADGCPGTRDNFKIAERVSFRGHGTSPKVDLLQYLWCRAQELLRTCHRTKASSTRAASRGRFWLRAICTLLVDFNSRSQRVPRAAQRRVHCTQEAPGNCGTLMALNARRDGAYHFLLLTISICQR